MNRTDINSRIDAMIARYLDNHNDAEAIDFLHKEAEASESRREYIRQQLEIWFASSACRTETEFDSDKAFGRFWGRIVAEMPSQAAEKPSGKLRHLGRSIAAAAIVLVVVLPWAGYLIATNQMHNRFADISVVAPRGSITELSLPDGTKVWLNSGSHISYSQGFGISNRDLRLVGEACFDVARNEHIPFRVNSHTAQLKVLGTKFNYRDYPSDRVLTVDLMRGNVSLTVPKSERSVTMSPDERVTIDKRTGDIKLRPIDSRQSAAWIRGEQFFDEVGIGDIALTLERAYNVNIKVSPTLKGCRFYCAFNTKDYELEDVLSMLRQTHRVKYRHQGNTYTLY